MKYFGTSCAKRCYGSRKYHNLSTLFLTQAKPQPTDSQFTCRSHKLMLYNAIIHQEHSGVYHLLPMGQRAMDKLLKIVERAMSNIGAHKLTMPCLTSGALWKKSGRWDVMGAELFRLKDRHDTDLCLGPTHEESVCSLVASQSPLPSRSLPLLLYQITTKFRDEIVPKYGLLRGREFTMKDMYTFDKDEASARVTYNKVCQAYCHILNTLQLPYTQVEAATGNIGGILSHEFHLPSPDAGEDKLLICPSCGTGYSMELVNQSMESATHHCTTPQCGAQLQPSLGIEVGHTFLLGQKYSSQFNATYKDTEGKTCVTEMGCYGFGVSRILQAAIQVLSLENEIRWPYLIAPYKVCIIPQKEGYKAEEFMSKSHELAADLETIADLDSDVILDDRTELTVGRRLYEAKRRGFPHIVIVNKRALDTAAPHFEFIDVRKDDSTYLSRDQIYTFLQSLSTPSTQNFVRTESL